VYSLQGRGLYLKCIVYREDVSELVYLWVVVSQRKSCFWMVVLPVMKMFWFPR